MDQNIINGVNNEDSDSNEIQPIDENMFKEMVLTWLKLDDKIKAISEEVKELKNEKKQFEDQIIQVMTNKNEDIINFSTGKLKKNVLQSKGALKEDIIQEAITELTKDVDKAYSMTQYIIQKRPISEKISLKRSSNSNVGKKIKSKK